MNTKSFLSSSLANFKEMPLLLKLLFVFSIYTVVATLFDIIQMKPILFEYFASGFPKNFPLIWYVYTLLINVFSIFVYLKRSYSLLKKYLYLTAGLLALAFLNSVYFINNNVPAEQITATLVLYTISFVFGGLIVVYQFQQKKYFNQV